MIYLAGWLVLGACAVGVASAGWERRDPVGARGLPARSELGWQDHRRAAAQARSRRLGWWLAAQGTVQ